MRRLAEAHSRPGAVFYRYFRSAGGNSVISRAPRFRCADDGDWKMTRRWVDESLLISDSFITRRVGNSAQARSKTRRFATTGLPGN
jgi:hypothetical protein